MASVTRQPFAPLDGTRLQNLTSLKNRQNALHTSPAASKRKAELLDTDDAENLDPLLFAKRSKAAKSSSGSLKDGILKPSSHFILKSASPTPLSASIASPSPSLTATATPRRTIQPKSPAAKLNTGISKSSPLSAPAGRSPTRGKRAGILSNRRRTAGPFSRIDPPSFHLGGGNAVAPFSLDAALKGTIPSYASRSSAATAKPAPSSSKSSLNEPELKASWFFDIHEDTPEQEMTNLLQHGTRVLDISSDEESAQRARREGREDKENVPPVDDVSQTSARTQARLRTRGADDMVVEKERVALGEMKAADFYADGCDESSVIIVPADEEEERQEVQQQQTEKQEQEPIVKDFEFAPELKALPSVPVAEPELEAEPAIVPEQDFDVLMGRANESSSSKAAVLQPMEGTGESFELWESGSAKDENEAATPAAATEVSS